jgi:hypothetical protein
LGFSDPKITVPPWDDIGYIGQAGTGSWVTYDEPPCIFMACCFLLQSIMPPKASQGIARQDEAGAEGPSIESARRETLTWWNYIWHSRFIWVHMGSCSSCSSCSLVQGSLPCWSTEHGWNPLRLENEKRLGNPEWTVSASLASPVVDERGAKPRHCRPRPAPQVVAKACLGVKWSQDVACTRWTSHTVKFTWINRSDAIFGWIPLPTIVYSDVAVRPL